MAKIHLVFWYPWFSISTLKIYDEEFCVLLLKEIIFYFIFFFYSPPPFSNYEEKREQNGDERL